MVKGIPNKKSRPGADYQTTVSTRLADVRMGLSRTSRCAWRQLAMSLLALSAVID